MMHLISFLGVLLALLTCNVFSYRVTGPTTAINRNTGQRPARQDLRNLQGAGPAWDLYIQALQRFQAGGHQELLSWYQVAGIHGRPFVSWDNVQGQNQRGYCTHGSVIFPTWHRPYLALYEQVLWNHTQAIAAEYPQESRARYQTAADSFRIPYWDWASDANIPNIMSQPQVTINTPEGSDTLDNPLFRFEFKRPQGGSDSLLGMFATSPFTTRNGSANSILSSNANNIRDSTYNLLASQSSYIPFSNTAAQQNRVTRFGSIESIHDLIHGAIGGWMGLVPYSAFDPIFFLHHANVDRIFAIWQALYPNSFVGSQVNRFGTFTNAPGASEGINTPLTPFHSDNGARLYTSASARLTRTFGYTVPEVTDWNLSPNQIAANTLAAVQRLYGPRSTNNSPASFRNNSALARRQRYPSAPADGSYAVPSSLKGNDSTYLEWFANVRIDKLAIGEPFFIHFFIGDVPVESSSWPSESPTFVGTHVVFTNADMPGMANMTEATVFGHVPLTRRLIRLYNDGVIADLEVNTMRGFLKENLQWRAQRYDESEVPISDLPSLIVSVVNDIGGPVAGLTDRPDPESVPEITEGRAGGLPSSSSYDDSYGDSYEESEC